MLVTVHADQWARPPLQGGDIHLLAFNIDKLVNQFDYRVLSADEQHQASQFKFSKHRQFWMNCRCLLRHVLADYLDCQPETIVFNYNDYGKPSINDTLFFNLSHSHNRMLLAVSQEVDLGVDIERVRADFVSDDLAELCFSRRELDDFYALPADQKLSSFFHVWTCKEALIKAVGEGVSFGLKQLSVNVHADEPARLLAMKTTRVADWHLHRLGLQGKQSAVASDYYIAIAWQGAIKKVCYYTYL
ncbi:MAG: 4'-phosphopantetheinyl transferase superfamily protein [Pseudomonadota bacterium]